MPAIAVVDGYAAALAILNPVSATQACPALSTYAPPPAFTRSENGGAAGVSAVATPE